MSSILYNIIIAPIELVVEIVFELLFRLVGHNQGIAVIGVSVAISLLTLPLYRRADAVQQKERDTQKRLAYQVNRIKKAFKGDERFMMLQTYYRENNYSPLYALRGMLSLLLEIPFFIAAYHFLSHLEVLRGASFGFIADLGKPDGLAHLVRGGVNINLLPILMTAINCVSAAVYLRGFPLRDKVQTYGMALIFLVLLYNSPSGLVVYWTCNNIFSLAKNIFYKLRNPRKVAVILCAVMGTLLTLALFMSGVLNSRKKYVAVLLFQYAALLPLILRLAKNAAVAEQTRRFLKDIFCKLKKTRKVASVLCAVMGTLLTLALFMSGKLNSRKKYVAVLLFQYAALLPLILSMARNTAAVKRAGRFFGKLRDDGGDGSHAVFFEAGLFLVVLTGVLIPSAVIASSPAEFVKLGSYRNPLLFLVSSTCYAAGFFLLWAGIIRNILPDGGKRILDLLLWIASGIFLVNYMCFGHNMGVLTPLLVYEDGVSFSMKAKLLNAAAILALSCALFFLFRYRKAVLFSCAILSVSTAALSLTNIFRAQRLLSGMAYIKDMDTISSANKILPLSKSGKNVIVFMLDRAISGYVPYMFEEKPELKEQFAGFRYYPNTLSHGFFTNFGTPALFGGYEYTVTEMNKRSDELLADKHNEALKVLPTLFSANGYDVTVCDPPYAGYKWVPDLSIYDGMPGTKAHILAGRIKDDALVTAATTGQEMEKNERNFFCYSMFKISPLVISKVFYDKGNYLNARTMSKNELNSNFMKEYQVLTSLVRLTEVSDDGADHFLAIQNATTHEPFQPLQLPDYELKASVDNTGYKTAAEGHVNIESESQFLHYQTNMAALIQLGKWFDFMRQNDVYDNTRIILVADHGRGLAQFDYMLMSNPKIDVEWCNPLLMVKDFGSQEFTTSDEFMTNADVPTLAVSGVIDNPINPFTGKAISDSEKTAHPQVVTSSGHWDITTNNGTTFDTSDGRWYSVHDNIFKEENWTLVD